MAFMHHLTDQRRISGDLLFKAVFGFAIGAIAIFGAAAAFFDAPPNFPVAVAIGLIGAFAGGIIAYVVAGPTPR